jgi:hypothetical protein
VRRLKYLFSVLLVLNSFHILATPSSYLLDGLSTQPKLAFSVRKLSTNYSGYAIKVRRSSDDQTQDIGFGNDGSLDIVSLSNFVGSSSGYVVKWYDQSGNGNDLTQTESNDRQPRIISNGNLEIENTKPFIRFLGVYNSSYTTLKLASTFGTTAHVATVNKFVSGGDGFLLGSSSTFYWHSNPGGSGLFDFGNNAYAGTDVLNGAVWQNGACKNAYSANYNSQLAINQVAPASPYNETSWDNIGNDRSCCHYSTNGTGYAELIVFDQSISNNDRIYIDQSESAYFAISLTACTAAAPIIANDLSSQSHTVDVSDQNDYTLHAYAYPFGYGENLTYQWFVNSTPSNTSGTQIQGATSNDYIVDRTTVGDSYYYVVVTSSNGLSNTSTPALITVTDVNNQPTTDNPYFLGDVDGADINLCDNPSANLSVFAVINGQSTVSYQWYYSTGHAFNMGTSTLLTGQTDSELYFDNTFASGFYFCIATNDMTSETTISSMSGFVTIIDPVILNISGNPNGCGSVTLTASGGNSYTWDGGLTMNQASNTFTQTGIYNLTVSNISGCTISQTVQVAVSPVNQNSQSISIYNPDFTPIYQGGWQLNGTSVFQDDAYLRLTPDQTGQAGSAFWTRKIALSTNFSFSSFFTFKISPTWSRADGLTFTIQQATNTAGSNGGGLGYFDLPGRSIGIEYDTYTNSDENNNHIALDINGTLHNENGYQNLYTTNGFTEYPFPNTPPYVVSPEFDIADGALKYNWIDYDGINNILEVRISNTSNRPLLPTMKITNLSLAAIFENSDVFFGFTAATGGESEEHAINTFYAKNAYSPFPSNPVPCDYTQSSVNLNLTASNNINCNNYTSTVLVHASDQNENPFSTQLNVFVESGSATVTPNVVTTDQYGNASFVVSSVSTASVTIRTTSIDGGAYGTVEILKTDGLVISGDMNACVNTTVQLTTNDNTNGTWDSDDPSVANISSTGLISTGSTSGYTYISYTPTSGGCSVSGYFTVSDVGFLRQPVSTEYPIYINDTATTKLTVKLLNTSGTPKKYKWYGNTVNSINGSEQLIATHINSDITDHFILPKDSVGLNYYYCVAENTSGCTATSNFSGAIIVNYLGLSVDGIVSKSVFDYVSMDGNIGDNKGVDKDGVVFNIYPTTKGGDGLTQANPGTSAKQIKLDYPDAQDGFYWISIPGYGVKQIYCLMDVTYDGGGWMLAMKTGQSNTFNFDANYWYTSNTLNDDDITLNTGDAKYAVMNTYGAKDILAIWPDINNIGTESGSIDNMANWNWLQNDIFGGSQIPLIQFFAQSPNQVTIESSQNGTMNFSGFDQRVFSKQDGFTFYGFNYTGNPNYKVRWGFAWNNELSELTNDCSGGIGLSTSINYASGDINNVYWDQTPRGINRAASAQIFIR